MNFKITGMSCAACSARVENAVSKLPGVTECSVNLLTSSMKVEGSASVEQIQKAVLQAGYSAKLQKEKSLELNSSPALKRMLLRFFASLILLVLMFIIPNQKLKAIFSLSIMIINFRFFYNGIKSVFHLSPNMDTLVSLGSAASFVFGMYDGAAMIPTLITVGKILEEYSKGKTTNAISKLIKLSPKTAVIIKDGNQIEVPVENIQKGDIFAVSSGQNIPVDGVIIEGNACINEAAITGESIPVEKKEGDFVTCATTNTNGFIKCRALRVGNETTLAKIIDLITQSAASKAPVQKIADKVAGVFVPLVLAIAIITFTVWYFVSKDVAFSVNRAIAVLVVSCPCSLGLATPVAIMVGNGKGAKGGILFKNSVSLENTGKANCIVLDKTGTLTKGEPYVTQITSDSDLDQKELLQLALNLECKSNHPLAKAIVKKADEYNLQPQPVINFTEAAGSGVSAIYDGEEYFCGRKEGYSSVVLTKNGRLLGRFTISDEIREDSKIAVQKLNSLGLKVYMLTGDNLKTAQEVAKEVGIQNVMAQVSPEQKAQKITGLKKEGLVIMVGDGINDAPSLTVSDIGFAIGAGSDIAIDSADVVLVKNSLNDVVRAVKLSRLVYRNIKQNLFWAFFYNVIGIPLAAGCFINLFGWTINPVYCALAMSLSSFCVVMNALRINFYKI